MKKENAKMTTRKSAHGNREELLLFQNLKMCLLLNLAATSLQTSKCKTKPSGLGRKDAN